MPIYSPEGIYISYAIGTDLTAWRNADAALIATECQPTDLIDALQNVAIDYTDPETEETGEMSGSQYKTRRTTGKRTGRIVLPTYLQTGVGLYSTLGGCVSVDTVAEITTVLCTTKALSVENSTFHFWVSDGAGATTEYYCWINKGTGADPTETGTAIECDISGAGTAIEVAEVIDGLIDAKANVGCDNSGTATLTITNAQLGGVPDCCSSEGTSTGYTIAITTQGSTTHTITLASSQTPISMAIHFEKEMTGEDIRYDFLGHMPDYWKLICGEDAARWKARQEIAANFAYIKAGGDLAEPTKNTLPIFEWSDLQHASGAYTIKYNGTALEFDKRSLELTVPRTKPLWGVKGASKCPIEAFISGVGIELLVEGYLTGNNVRTLMAIEPEDYAGTGLDVEIKFYKATNNEFGITLANLYLVPDQTILSETDWYEKKELRFVSWGSTTAISSSVEDYHNKTFYENP